MAFSLVHGEGYFRQELQDGRQLEQDAMWRPEEHLVWFNAAVSVQLEGVRCTSRRGQYGIVGASGYLVPVLLLDSDLPANAQEDRALTHQLYGGDDR